MKLLRLWFCEKYFTIWLIWSWWAIIVYAIDRIWRKVRSCRGLVLKPSIDVVRQWSWFRHLCSLVLVGFFNNYCLYLCGVQDIVDNKIKVGKVHYYSHVSDSNAQSWIEINKKSFIWKIDTGEMRKTRLYPTNVQKIDMIKCQRLCWQIRLLFLWLHFRSHCL